MDQIITKALKDWIYDGGPFKVPGFSLKGKPGLECYSPEFIEGEHPMIRYVVSLLHVRESWDKLLTIDYNSFDEGE